MGKKSRRFRRVVNIKNSLDKRATALEQEMIRMVNGLDLATETACKIVKIKEKEVSDLAAIAIYSKDLIMHLMNCSCFRSGSPCQQGFELSNLWVDSCAASETIIKREIALLNGKKENKQ